MNAVQAVVDSRSAPSECQRLGGSSCCLLESRAAETELVCANGAVVHSRPDFARPSSERKLHVRLGTRVLVQ